MYSKRYSIFNKHIGGSNQLPQGFHGLNSLLSPKNKMSDEARALLTEWSTQSEVEVVLKGGTDEELEALFSALQEIDSIPSAKFNEPDLRNSCTIVTFVASERIVAGGILLRGNRVSSFDAEEFLYNNPVKVGNDFVELTKDEIFVVVNTAFLHLAN